MGRYKWTTLGYKTDVGIKDYEYLKVGTTTDEAKYIILKTNIGIQKVKKLIVLLKLVDLQKRTKQLVQKYSIQKL